MKAILSVFLVLFLIGCQMEGTDNQDIPPAVMESYEEVKELYQESLGSNLQRCVKDNEEIYVISGSGGFSGETRYFTAEGELIEIFHWDDIVMEDEPRPSINLEEYTCTTLIDDFR